MTITTPRSLRILGPLVLLALACRSNPSPSAEPAPASPPSTAAPVALTPASTVASAETAALGKAAPDFTAPDLDGKSVSLKDFRGKTVVLEWFNPGCPFVKKSHTVGSLVDTASRHVKNGVVWIAINSGAPGKQGHGKEVNVEARSSWKMEHPVLLDENGSIGRAYGAERTPHMYVIDPKGVLVYRGAIDNSPDGEKQSPQGGTLVNHVDAALADLAAGRPVAVAETKAYGCSVKY
jgi:alkyl hydroperoxide reductase subunit AhpC